LRRQLEGSKMSSTPKIVNKSGVVLTKDGRRLFGMDAELYQKMSAKEDPDWDNKVMRWIEEMLGEKMASDDLWVVLKNGIVLIRLLNTIKADTVPKYNKTRLVPLLEMDNIHLYLKGCWALGVPSECMFTSAELHKRQDMSKVSRNLEALSKIAVNFGSKVTPLDSTQKAPPKMIQMVETGDDKKDEDDAVELVSKTRDQIRKARATCEELEKEEGRLKDQIAETKRAWRDEKTQLVYAVSNAEKAARKAEEKDRPIRPTTSAKKTSILPGKGPVMVRTASMRHTADMKDFAKARKQEAEEALATESKLLEIAKDRRKRLADEEAVLKKETEDLERQVAQLEAETMHLEKELEAAVAVTSPVVTHKPVAAPSSPVTSPSKRYTRLVNKGEAGSVPQETEYFFYETDVTSTEMVNYLTMQLERLFKNKDVSFEDLFKLKQLLETDEGRRVFCFVLFSTIRAKKRGSGDRKILLSSDSFDLVLWLINTVLQSMSTMEDKIDFFAARVLMKYSRLIVRELSVATASKDGPNAPKKSPRTLLSSVHKETESIQRFIKSDPMWRSLVFWQELFNGDVNKKFKKKFSGSSVVNLGGSGPMAPAAASPSLSGREKKFVIQFVEKMLHEMGVEWCQSRQLQENFVASVSEDFGLTQGEVQKLLKEIVDVHEESGLRNSGGTGGGISPRARSPTVKSKLIQQYTVKQKREVFGAPLRPRKVELMTAFQHQDEVARLNENEAEHILPGPIWDLILFMENDEKCLNTAGIFRQSGDTETLQLLRAQIEAGETVDWSKQDVHDTAGIFKLYLRELPEPVTTYDAYNIIQTAVELSGDQRLMFVSRLTRKIPDANRIVLKKVLLLLRKFAQRSGVNKMTAKNLSLVFTPALFRSRKPDVKAMSDAPKYAEVVEYLIQECETFF